MELGLSGGTASRVESWTDPTIEKGVGCEGGDADVAGDGGVLRHFPAPGPTHIHPIVWYYVCCLQIAWQCEIC